MAENFEQNAMQPTELQHDPTQALSGTYEAQFASIRADICARLQTLGAEYAMCVQKLVRTCIMTGMQINALAELHAKNIARKLKSCNVDLVNFTNCNAMLNIDGWGVLVTFDLSKPGNSILTAKYIQPLEFNTQADVTVHALTLRYLQALMLEPIDDTNIVVPYAQLRNAVAEAKRDLANRKAMLHETIRSRAFTAFDFEPGMSFYTVNYSDDMSMIFWDRYTITDATAKSYYVEQHCIVEHIISGDIEPERYIALHKPSKNSMAMFLADKLACLTALTRPAPTVDAIPTTEVPVVETVADEDDDEGFTEEELVAMGIDPDTVDPSNIKS